MSREWHTLTTFDAWARTLADILREAATAIEQGSNSAKLEVLAELNAYIDNSPNRFASNLDEMARKAMEDVWRDTAERALQGISSRTAELTAYMKAVQAATEDAEGADTARHVARLTRVVESTTTAISAAREFADSLEGIEGEDLAEDLRKLMKTLQNLRNKIEA